MISKIRILIFSLLVFTVQNIFGQAFNTFNSGGINQKGYHAIIPYEEHDHLMIVKVSINGKEYRFLFDTGAMTSITESLFDELKFPVCATVQLFDQSNKKDSMNVVVVPELQIESLIFSGIPAGVLKNSIIFECLKLDGIIGSNSLRNSIVQFASDKQQIIISDNPEVFRLKSKKKYSVKLNLSLDGQSSPYIWIKLKGKKTVRIESQFDTGQTDLFNISLNHFRELQKYDFYSIVSKTEGSNTLGILGNASDTVQYRLGIQNMIINKSVLNNPVITTTSSSGSRIGAELLKYGIVTIDFPGKKFYFEPFFDKAKDIYKKQMPISLTIKDGKIVIGTVWNESLKQEVSNGNQVIAIDNVNVENMSPCDLFTSYDNYFGKDTLLLRIKKFDDTFYDFVIRKE